LAQLLARYLPDPTPSRVRKAVQEGEAVQVVRPSRAPGDWRQLRGLPVVAEGVQGAMFGTRPDYETIRKLDRVL
jgi:hypothetical protein